MDATSDMDFCAVCRKETTKICSKCKEVSYCGKKCQLSDWKSHEPHCELVLDNVAWCDVCNASQDLRVPCFQCGFVFCGPCFESGKKSNPGFCPGCSRLTIDCHVNEANIGALMALADQEMNRSNPRRNFWCYALAQMFDLFEPKNITLEKHYLKLSGDLGCGAGYAALGAIYLNEGDNDTAKELFEKGATSQNVEAMFNLGKLYFDGKLNGNVDYRAAKKWFKEGSRLGDEACIYQLGVMYYLGDGTTENHEKAVSRFRRGAKKGDARSQYMLGECYCLGKGVVQSIKQAQYWLEKAAAQGHEKAVDLLRHLRVSGV